MNTSVLDSPARTFKALSSDDLRRCAPSVFADHARPGVSFRYTFVSTVRAMSRGSARPFDVCGEKRGRELS